jgi:hypothetical protein
LTGAARSNAGTILRGIEDADSEMLLEKYNLTFLLMMQDATSNYAINNSTKGASDK